MLARLLIVAALAAIFAVPRRRAPCPRGRPALTASCCAPTSRRRTASRARPPLPGRRSRAPGATTSSSRQQDVRRELGRLVDEVADDPAARPDDRDPARAPLDDRQPVRALRARAGAHREEHHALEQALRLQHELEGAARAAAAYDPRPRPLEARRGRDLLRRVVPRRQEGDHDDDQRRGRARVLQLPPAVAADRRRPVARPGRAEAPGRPPRRPQVRLAKPRFAIQDGSVTTRPVKR
jgi:hypothetical protein